MITGLRHKDIERVFKTSIVQQTAFWSEVKRNLGVNSVAFDFEVKRSDVFDIAATDNNSIVSDVLVIIQQVDSSSTIAYVPYGPELEPFSQNQGAFLEELSECLRSFLPKNCIMIRYDLSWESYWARESDYYTKEGVWIGPPDKEIQEIRFNYSTINWNFKKTFSNILPSNTVFVNLTKDSDDLLASIKPKTRYNIGLSLKKGVAVRVGGVENLETWYSLYTDTAHRNSFYLHSIDYFKAIITANADNTMSPADVLLLIAEIEDVPLAAMFLVMTGNRATYLYGASSSKQRNLMATYALQWEAMNIAKERGCTEYDMFGVAPTPDPLHPMFGLYRFKTGFGGKIFHRMGCWDYPLLPDKYSVYSTIELARQGFHLG